MRETDRRSLIVPIEACMDRFDRSTGRRRVRRACRRPSAGASTNPLRVDREPPKGTDPDHWRLLTIALVVAGCSAVATPSAAPTANATVVPAASASAPTAPVASASTDANVSPLEGTWATGPVSIDVHQVVDDRGRDQP